MIQVFCRLYSFLSLKMNFCKIFIFDNRNSFVKYTNINGHVFEQAPGVGDGQGSPRCCSPWCPKESDTTWWLNNTQRELDLDITAEETSQITAIITTSSLEHYLCFSFHFDCVGFRNISLCLSEYWKGGKAQCSEKQKSLLGYS